MRMFFRTFSGYYDGTESGMFRFLDEPPADPDALGREIVYSGSQMINARCRSHGKGYLNLPMSRQNNWHELFCRCVAFMEDYLEIGCATFYDEERNVSRIATESVFTNAYATEYPDSPFFIIFNARPVVQNSRNRLTIGHDKYSFELDTGSIIVWNLDRYDWFNDDKHTLWGIRQNTGQDLSMSDDVMVGIRGNEVEYALR